MDEPIRKHKFWNKLVKMNLSWVDQLNITFLKMICKKWTAYKWADQKTQVFKSICYYKLLMDGAIKKEIFLIRISRMNYSWVNQLKMRFWKRISWKQVAYKWTG
jgi:hypothetical protein